MAMKPQLPKKKAQVTTRDLKAKKNPKGGAQKKESQGTAGSNLSKVGRGQIVL